MDIRLLPFIKINKKNRRRVYYFWLIMKSQLIPSTSHHFISRLSMIVQVNVVLNRTIVVDSDWRLDNLCGSHLQSHSEFYHISWRYTLVIDLISQLSCNTIFDTIIARLVKLPSTSWPTGHYSCYKQGNSNLHT